MQRREAAEAEHWRLMFLVKLLDLALIFLRFKPITAFSTTEWSILLSATNIQRPSLAKKRKKPS
jgi:hypothetical protein